MKSFMCSNIRPMYVFLDLYLNMTESAMRPVPKTGKASKIQGKGNDGGRQGSRKEHKRRDELGRLEGGDSRA